jgi:5-methylcytosine-specific restriction endonuclease McrA
MTVFIPQHTNEIFGYRRRRISRYLKKKFGYRHYDREMLRSDPCSYCGGEGGTVDHIEPRCRGGENDIVNYAGSCFKCNQDKKDVPLLSYLLEIRNG